MLLALVMLPLICEVEAPRLAIADQPSLSKPGIPYNHQYTIRASQRQKLKSCYYAQGFSEFDRLFLRRYNACESSLNELPVSAQIAGRIVQALC